jgi:hypothetical protein
VKAWQIMTMISILAAIGVFLVSMIVPNNLAIDLYGAAVVVMLGTLILKPRSN